MSVKSLLQFILFFLIILIIGGIYYLYFYTTSSNIINENLKFNKFSKDNAINNEVDKESMNLNLIEPEDKLIGLKKNENIKEKREIKKESLNNIDQSTNLTKEIEYLTTDENGNIYKIFAKFGKTNIQNNNILNLEVVNGEVIKKDGSNVYIKSDYANYNYNNQNSNFYGNVKINYENKEINCDNFNVDIEKNIAVAYNNVLVSDEKSTMRASTISLDLLTNDLEINSDEKIKILSQ